MFPNSSLRIEAQILSHNDNTATASSRVLCDEQVVADATLVFGFIQKDLLTEGFNDEVLKAYLERTRPNS